VLAIVTAALSILVFYWKPNWKVRLFYSKCSVQDADLFILEVQTY